MMLMLLLCVIMKIAEEFKVERQPTAIPMPVPYNGDLKFAKHRRRRVYYKKRKITSASFGYLRPDRDIFWRFFISLTGSWTCATILLWGWDNSSLYFSCGSQKKVFKRGSRIIPIDFGKFYSYLSDIKGSNSWKIFTKYDFWLLYNQVNIKAIDLNVITQNLPLKTVYDPP